MKLRYSKSFERDLGVIKRDAQIKRRLRENIEMLKEAESTSEIKGIRSITGFPGYYRLRVGDYRLGLKLSGDTLDLIRFLHRRDIYRRFPVL